MASIDQFTSRSLLKHGKMAETCKAEVEKFNIRTPSINQRVEMLSGGNQQKVLLSRWMLTDPDVLILDEPTRGIDIGAKSEIYRLMSDLAQRGRPLL